MVARIRGHGGGCDIFLVIFGMVDMIFSSVAHPDYARISALNASNLLKPGGQFLTLIKVNCIDSTVLAEVAFVQEVNNLQHE